MSSEATVPMLGVVGLGVHALAAAGDGHAAQEVHEGGVRSKVIHRGLARFRHALHERLGRDAPLALALAGVDHGLADAPVGAACADVLVRAAGAAQDVALEVREAERRIVGQHSPQGFGRARRSLGSSAFGADAQGQRDPQCRLEAASCGVGVEEGAPREPKRWKDASPAAGGTAEPFRHVCAESAPTGTKRLLR